MTDKLSRYGVTGEKKTTEHFPIKGLQIEGMCHSWSGEATAGLTHAELWVLQLYEAQLKCKD